MAEFRRAAHARVAQLLSRMDGPFLASAGCFFGGGTQLVVAHGEYRESRDIDFLLSSRDGFRRIRETITEHSLGRIFRKPVRLVRELVADRDSVRTFVAEDAAGAAHPIKLEILLEGRIDLEGDMDERLGVPALAPAIAAAEKLLANVDRGNDHIFRCRDLIDLAFAATVWDQDTLRRGLAIAQKAYGKAVLEAARRILVKLEEDGRYRRNCLSDLMIEDEKRLRRGMAALRTFLNAEKRRAGRSGGPD
jgi:hypothetical protein